VAVAMVGLGAVLLLIRIAAEVLSYLSGGRSFGVEYFNAATDGYWMTVNIGAVVSGSLIYGTRGFNRFLGGLIGLVVLWLLSGLYQINESFDTTSGSAQLLVASAFVIMSTFTAVAIIILPLNWLRKKSMRRSGS
jgi:hypothetical protein